MDIESLPQHCNIPVVQCFVYDSRVHPNFSLARQSRIPGGVNSPVRAFRGVDGEPFFVERAEGRKDLGRRWQ